MRRAKDKQLGGATESYSTPRWTTRRLLEWMCKYDPNRLEAAHVFSGAWLEPAVGNLAIVDAVVEYAAELGIVRDEDLRERRLEWNWVGIDILPGVKGRSNLDAYYTSTDFLDWAPPLAPFRVGITNPPFSLAEEYIRLISALCDVAFMLLPLQFYASAEREDLFQLHPPAHILVVPDRIQFVDPTVELECPRCCGSGEPLEGEFGVACPKCRGSKIVKASSPMSEHAWFGWNRFHRGPAQIERLRTTPLPERKWWLASSADGSTQEEPVAAAGRSADEVGESAGDAGAEDRGVAAAPARLRQGRRKGAAR